MNTVKINFESLVQVHWSDEQKQNAKIVVNFVQTLMNDHDFDRLKKEFGNSIYTQHNRSIADGIDGVLASVGSLTKRFPDFSYDVKRVLVDSEFVTLHSHVTVNKKHRGNETKGYNIIDTWQVKNGKPAEHWDAVQPLDAFMRLYYWLTGGSILNNNGVF